MASGTTSEFSRLSSANSSRSSRFTAVLYQLRWDCHPRAPHTRPLIAAG
jgi:hypothetical protein